MLGDVVTSIYEPGVNTGLLQFVTILFIVLVIVLVAIMVFVDFNIHLVILTFLAVGVGSALQWYAVALPSKAVIILALNIRYKPLPRLTDRSYQRGSHIMLFSNTPCIGSSSSCERRMRRKHSENENYSEIGRCIFASSFLPHSLLLLWTRYEMSLRSTR